MTPLRHKDKRFLVLYHSKRRVSFSPCSMSSTNDDSVAVPKQNQLGYDPSEELLGLGVDLKPRFMLLFLNSFISFISSKCELILAFGTSLL